MQLQDVNSLEETAEYLRISPTVLKNLARSQKIGSLKQGRAITFPRKVIEAYIAGNTIEQAGPNPWGLTDASLRRSRRS